MGKILSFSQVTLVCINFGRKRELKQDTFSKIKHQLPFMDNRHLDVSKQACD